MKKEKLKKDDSKVAASITTSSPKKVKKAKKNTKPIVDEAPKKIHKPKKVAEPVVETKPARKPRRKAQSVKHEEIKKPEKRKITLSPTLLSKTDATIAMEPKKRTRRKSEAPEGKSVVVVAPEKCIEPEKKKTRKRKKDIDIIEQADNIQPEKKKRSRKKIIHDDDDFKEGQKPKRKRRSKEDKPIYPDCTFKDSMEIPGGDARIAFCDGTDEVVPHIFWCSKKECRLMQRLCSIYVTPACKKKLRCEFFEYGMTVRSRFGVKTYTDPTPKNKKPKEDGDFLGIEEEESED